MKIKCQDPDNAKAGVFQGYLWVVSRPGDDVCFDWRTSRRHGELTTLIEGFDGVLQSDGYEAYAAYERAHPGVAWVGCWAHARRKLIEAQGENPKAVRVALKLIGRLYGVEREWDEADLAAGRERDVAERARLPTSKPSNFTLCHSIRPALRKTPFTVSTVRTLTPAIDATITRLVSRIPEPSLGASWQYAK